MTLNRQLVRTFMTMALAGFVAASVFTLIWSAKETARHNAILVDRVVDLLQRQPGNFKSSQDLMATISSWPPENDGVSMREGQCIEFLDPEGPLVRSLCVGVGFGGLVPQWFTEVYRACMPSTVRYSLNVVRDDGIHGTVVGYRSRGAAAIDAWANAQPTLRLFAAYVAVLCVLAFVVLLRTALSLAVR